MTEKAGPNRIVIVEMPFPRPGGLYTDDELRVECHRIAGTLSQGMPIDTIIGVWPDGSSLVAKQRVGKEVVVEVKRR